MLFFHTHNKKKGKLTKTSLKLTCLCDYVLLYEKYKG